MDDIPFAWQYALLALLLVVSGFFSIAETSMMALNRYRLRAMVRLGRPGARAAAELLAQTDRLLGTILLGNNLVNAAAATLVSVITINLFGEDRIALGMGTLAITFLLLVFSEITPKVVGAAYAERVAPYAAIVLKPLLWILYPLVWSVHLFVAPLLAVFRVRRNADTSRLTMEELRALVLESGPFMAKKPQSILANMFELETTTVEDIMTPRARIEAIDLQAPIETIREQIATAYHTRLPVYRSEPGTVVGVVHLRKVLHFLHRGELQKEAIEEILAEPYFVPASTPVFTQLQYFQENHQRLALVVDEYGELLGLVTLEDIIEEFVGEFTTTAPERTTNLVWNEQNTVMVEGTTPLRELNRRLALALPLSGPKTLNGLLLEHLQDIPEAGVSLRIAGTIMEIVQTEDRVIRSVRIFRPLPAPSDAA